MQQLFCFSNQARYQLVALELKEVCGLFYFIAFGI